MKKSQLIDIIRNEESLGKITIEHPVEKEIVLRISAIEHYKRVIMIGWLKKFALPLLVAGIILFLAFLSNFSDGEKIVLVYPYGGEGRVELIGSFNNWNERIPLILDEKKGVWKTELIIKKKGIYEYQFIIDNVIYTAGDSAYKIRDTKGSEKAILSI